MRHADDIRDRRVVIDQIYREHGSGAYRFALRLCGEQNDAEDVLMEAFVRLHESLPTIRDLGGVKVWLYRAVLNQWRKKVRRKRPEVSTCPEVVDTFGLDATERLALWSAMAELPEKLRVAVWLVKGEGLTYKEAAEVLRVPMGTVQDRVFRGTKKLREALDPAYDAEGKFRVKNSEAKI